MPGGDDYIEPSHGLANEALLAAIPDCFAKTFFSRALKPRFRYIAPSLRIQATEELQQQPFAQYLRLGATRLPPLILFRGDDEALPTTSFEEYDHDAVPAGLYIDSCDPDLDPLPFDDGARLILPYELGSEDGESHPVTADRKPLFPSNDMLYQIGWNPFVAPHPTRLVVVLELWHQ